MNKKLKFLFLVTTFYASLNTASFAAIGGGSSTVTAGESPYKSFSESAVGAGLSIGARFNLAEDVFTDSEDKSSPCLGGSESLR